MIIFQWVLSILFLVIGLFFCVINWMHFTYTYILKKKCGSAFTLMGGCFCGLGIYLMPIDGIQGWAILPFFIDWGSFPIIVAAVITAMSQKDE